MGVACVGSKRSRSLPEVRSNVPVVESYARGVPGGVRLDDMAEPSSVMRATKPTGTHADGTAPSNPGKSTEPACPARYIPVLVKAAKLTLSLLVPLKKVEKISPDP